MKQKKHFLQIIFILILIILSFINQEIFIKKADDFRKKMKNLEKNEKNNINFINFIKNNLNLNKKSQNHIQKNLTEITKNNISINFCPKNNCEKLLYQSFKNAKFEIKCAFFEFDNLNLSNILKQKSNSTNISLIVDNLYLNEKPLLNLKNLSIKIFSDKKRNTKFNNFMHNKFCIIDKKILITGSTNPTKNGLFKNNNNLIKIESKYLSKNYLNEFEQMQNLIFGQNKKSTLNYNNISLNFKNEKFIISSFFCPQDNCQKQILNNIKSAKKQILVSSFAITNKKICLSLINKSKQKIDIKIIIEKRNKNLKSSCFNILNKSNLIYVDKNKYNMHHKFFIIDNFKIITGSANPTNAGFFYNDENIIIIENKNLANKFSQEFYSLI